MKTFFDISFNITTEMFSQIELLSIKSESQKVKLNSTYLTDEDSVNIFMIEGLVEQEPITIF